MPADVVPFPSPPRRGGRDDVVMACPCGCPRFRATVTVLLSGRVDEVAPLLVCDGCGAAHVLRTG